LWLHILFCYDSVICLYSLHSFDVHSHFDTYDLHSFIHFSFIHLYIVVTLLVRWCSDAHIHCSFIHWWFITDDITFVIRYSFDPHIPSFDVIPYDHPQVITFVWPHSIHSLHSSTYSPHSFTCWWWSMTHSLCWLFIQWPVDIILFNDVEMIVDYLLGIDDDYCIVIHCGSDLFNYSLIKYWLNEMLELFIDSWPMKWNVKWWSNDYYQCNDWYIIIIIGHWLFQWPKWLLCVAVTVLIFIDSLFKLIYLLFIITWLFIYCCCCWYPVVHTLLNSEFCISTFIVDWWHSIFVIVIHLLLFVKVLIRLWCIHSMLILLLLCHSYLFDTLIFDDDEHSFITLVWRYWNSFIIDSIDWLWLMTLFIIVWLLFVVRIIFDYSLTLFPHWYLLRLRIHYIVIDTWPLLIIVVVVSIDAVMIVTMTIQYSVTHWWWCRYSIIDDWSIRKSVLFIIIDYLLLQFDYCGDDDSDIHYLFW